MLLFSVVIPTCQRLHDLSLCLACLAPYLGDPRHRELAFQVEVIVSDDGCDPSLQQHLTHHYPWARYEKGPGRGPAANRNHGASVALGNWLVFTDDDCLPQPGWLEAFHRFLDVADILEGRTAACGQRKRVDEESPINDTGGTLLSCNFAIRADVFRCLGGFNEVFTAPAMEDYDLNVRVKALSYLKCNFVHDALVLHPWRYRKGRNYSKVHAQSVALFLSLHPEYATGFTMISQVKKILRSIKATALFSFGSGIYAGLLRQLCLEAYSNYLTWRFARQLSAKN